ncbi:hypothetical protein LBMAG47_06720 [Planctomycetia bacterium]|nr:hypothetical protein LBMAG47_06720 [Planctomycetia bacterium]
MSRFQTLIALGLAIVPLGLYLVGIGCLHLRRRPSLLQGSLDFALLAAGVAGLVLVGPLALLAPLADGIPAVAGVPVLLAGFLLLVAVAVLAMRPRLVIYNITLDQLRPVVAEVVTGLDASARWAGETAALPARGIQVHLDGRGSMRSVSVVAVGSRTSPEGWTEFSRRLRQAVGRLRVRSSPWGGLFGGLGGIVLVTAISLALGGLLLPRRSAPALSSPQPRPPASPASGASHAPPHRPVCA